MSPIVRRYSGFSALYHNLQIPRFDQDQPPSHNPHLNCREPFQVQHTRTEKRPIAHVNLSGGGYEAQLSGPLWLTLGHTLSSHSPVPAARTGQSCNTPATEQPPSWRGAPAAPHYRFGMCMSGFTVNNADQPIDRRSMDLLKTCRLSYLVFGGIQDPLHPYRDDTRTCCFCARERREQALPSCAGFNCGWMIPGDHASQTARPGSALPITSAMLYH
jgi:hypothetical protein